MKSAKIMYQRTPLEIYLGYGEEIQEEKNQVCQISKDGAYQNAGNDVHQIADRNVEQRAGHGAVQSANYGVSQFAENYAVQIARARSHQVADHDSVQISGNNSKFNGGLGTVQVCRYGDRQVSVKIVGEDGHKPHVTYQCVDGVWTEVAE